MNVTFRELTDKEFLDARLEERIEEILAPERGPDVRFHVVKNRWLTLLRNETASGFLAHLPWIAARDAATLALLAVSSPSVLGRLWKGRSLFAEAWRGCRLDFIRGRHLDSPSR